jgi:regulator of protease activity HflC (stomatin/prohibitin superfamily)
MAANGSDDPVIDLERIRAQLGQFKLPSMGGGSWVMRLLIPVALAFVAYKLLVFFCLTYVGPNEYGIKVVRIPVLSARGVHEEVYNTGFHVVLRLFDVEEMYLFPKDVQVLDLTGMREEAAYEAAVTKAAHIQTSDGFFVDIDVSILYRIVQPHLVFTTLGPGRLFETNGIVPKAEPVLKQTLGELTTEEFYNSPLRAAKAAMAKEFLNRELNPYGLAVDQVLVRYFRYTEEIQKNIEEKKLKDQLVFKNQAEGRAAVEGAKLKKMIQEGQANLDIKLQEGRAYVTTKEAERDLYVRSKRADADLQVKLAEARRTQLRNDALQGAGSDRMVGLKMADVYKGLDVVVLPSDGAHGINPLDLQQALKLFEIRR